jgi:gamma-glutamyltranspeptidase/glutathione hydrolase
MTPVIVLKDGRPYLTVGSPGGPYIIGVVAQVLHHVLDHGMDIQAALNAPRLSSQNKPLELEWFHPRRDELVKALRQRGWQVRDLGGRSERTFGNAHGIRIRPDGTLEGGADPRMEGAARGY